MNAQAELNNPCVSAGATAECVGLEAKADVGAPIVKTRSGRVYATDVRPCD